MIVSESRSHASRSCSDLAPSPFGKLATMTQHAWAAALSILVLAFTAPAASARDKHAAPCRDCGGSTKRYDTQEVIKTTRDVDHSRVINTTSVVVRPVYIRPVRTVVNFVVHHYAVVSRPVDYESYPAPRAVERDCRPSRRHVRGGCGTVLRVRG
jgi:hypothetical protein